MTKSKRKVDRAEKQRWYSGFRALARQWGYKDGWAARQYQSKFDVWPRGLDKIAGPVDPDVRSYAKSSLIRFAKRREAREAAHA